MEDTTSWEQPQEENEQTADAQIETNTSEENNKGSQIPEGSHFGKFKDADSLFSAYNSLQAEFTRKCQKLSELEKKVAKSEEVDSLENGISSQEENLVAPNINQNLGQNNLQDENCLNADVQNELKEQKSNNENIENIKKYISPLKQIDGEQNKEQENEQNQNIIQTTNLENTKEENTLIFAQSDWNEKVCEFLSKNELAKDYKQEISLEILNDKSLQTDKNALDVAFYRVMQKEFKSPKNILEDENFVNNNILSNEKIKNQIIQNYIKNISSSKPPLTINSGSGNITFSTQKKATNLSDAKLIVEEMFKVQGEN